MTAQDLKRNQILLRTDIESLEESIAEGCIIQTYRTLDGRPCRLMLAASFGAVAWTTADAGPTLVAPFVCVQSTR
jgi:hypothetical protein